MLAALKNMIKPLVVWFLIKKLPFKKSIGSKVSDKISELKGSYYVTTDKGLYRVSPHGIIHILDVPMFGFCLSGDHFFAALNYSTYSLIVRGDKTALEKPGQSFDFRIIYKLKTPSTNDRVHQITLGDEAVWAANTAHNSLLKIDPKSALVAEEIFPFKNDKGDVIRHNQNHINSVTEYGGLIFFTAYHGKTGSYIGVIEDNNVSVYEYKNKGVHDIYLKGDGFYFSDTFGAGARDHGGVPVTDKGEFAPNIFAKPPGFIVRGAAQHDEEVVIGHSHKGERQKRFDGQGALLVFRDNKLQSQIDMPAAQIYQVLSIEGDFFQHDSVDIENSKAKFQSALGAPKYKAIVENKSF